MTSNVSSLFCQESKPEVCTLDECDITAITCLSGHALGIVCSRVQYKELPGVKQRPLVANRSKNRIIRNNQGQNENCFSGQNSSRTKLLKYATAEITITSRQNEGGGRTDTRTLSHTDTHLRNYIHYKTQKTSFNTIRSSCCQTADSAHDH